MMVRHGLDMSKPPKPEKPSTLTTTPFKKASAVIPTTSTLKTAMNTGFPV